MDLKTYYAYEDLGGLAMSYAAKAIVMPDETSPLPELERVRQIVADDGAPLVSSQMADALKDLQVGAVVFTFQAARSNYHSNRVDFWQLEERLVELLFRRGAVRMGLSYDLVVAAQALGARAIDYARDIVDAEDRKAPYGSSQRALADFEIAAIGFAVRLAVSEGEESKLMRRVEKKLTAVFAHQEVPS